MRNLATEGTAHAAGKAVPATGVLLKSVRTQNVSGLCFVISVSSVAKKD
jgi:hypothetical protein